MRLRTHLRALRGSRSLGDLSARTGIGRGDLSNFERGHAVPRDALARRMELVYGPREGWYPPATLRAIGPDIATCPGCDAELEPDATRRRVFHDEKCRRLARTKSRP